VKVSINGEVFEYDQNRLLMAEMLPLEDATGLSYGEWQSGLSRMTAQSLGALAWLLWRRAGRDVSWDDIKSGAVELNLPDMEFLRDEEPPDPTVAPAAKRASRSTGTGISDSSPSG
jgi:hypothetical protein